MKKKKSVDASADPKKVENSKVVSGGVGTSSMIVDVVENEMTLEERSILAYLLRYEVMVKSQEAEDMAVREHLLPIFEKLSSGKSWLSFSEMHRWGKILEKSTPEENYVVTDSQLAMILETFGSPGVEEGWTLTAFTFCYKFIILGMQTLQHLSRQDETVRQRFKETFFQMLHQYHPENNPQTYMSAPENTIDDEQDTKVMRQLLTLKDRQMSKLIFNMEQDDQPSKQKSTDYQELEADDKGDDENVNGVDNNDEKEHQANGEDEDTKSNVPSVVKRENSSAAVETKNIQPNKNFINKILLLTVFLGFVIVGIVFKIYMLPTINQPSWQRIETSALLELPLASKVPNNMKSVSNQKSNSLTIRQFSSLNKQLSNSLEKSEKDLNNARLQIQSLVLVLTDMQQSQQEEKTIQYFQNQNNSVVYRKPKPFKKFVPIVLSILGGVAITFSIQQYVIPSHLFSKLFLSRGGAIMYLHSTRWLGRIKIVLGRVSRFSSRPFLAFSRP